MDLSISMPGIRTHNWLGVLNSIKESCKKYSWEVTFAGPFDPPAEIAHFTNVHFIKTFANASAACQMAAEQAIGWLHTSLADDGLLLPNALDESIDLYFSWDHPKKIINLTYTEDVNYTGQPFPESFWFAHSHGPLQCAGVPKHYRTSMAPMFNTQQYKELGGLDCAYEYPNFNLHDLIFRAQYDGFEIRHSPNVVSKCDHYRDKDHVVIEHAHDVDMHRFREKWNNPNVLHSGMVHIPFDNWKNHAHPWERRFKGRQPSTYQELLNG